MAQMSPWLRSARVPMLAAMLPALVLVAALIYFTGWAITYSFTNLELPGANSIIWKWIGFDKYVRLFTRQGFLASALRCLRGVCLTSVEVAIMHGWLLPDIVAAFLWQATTTKIC